MSPPAAAAQAVRARTAVPARPLRPVPRPRRVSGPARREPPRAPVRRAAPGEGGVVLGLLGAVQRVSRHRLLDRLIRGRTWIALVAFALLGIVTLQLGLLKLNAGIGRSIERSALLQRENAALSIENSELAAGNRVEATAAHLGMQLVAPGDLRFLSARPRADAAQAAAALAAPLHTATASGEEASSSAAATATTTPSTSESSASASSSAETASSAGSSPTSEGASTASPSPGEAGAEATPPAAESRSSTSESSTAGASPSAPATGAPAGLAAETTPAGGTQAAPGG